MIVCVAVVGHQNNPLYIQSFTEAEDALKLHHIVHCSLDVIDERVNNPSKSGTTLNEAFLGLLYPALNYKVYGYLTNTKVKFIMVTTDLDVRDTDVRSVCFFYLPKLVHSFFFCFLLFLLCTYSSSGSSMPHTWMPSQTLSMFLAKRSLPEPSPNPLPTLLPLTLSTDDPLHCMFLFH
ncbi:unnamed protein product [Brassica rapa]|uniref:Trafficking protein particle complex subunit 2-like protein n=1 Tax=Brassica campestris TaxID=3711 RepID=A0A8D9DCF5_BRACM|nr:unnamed protein product [Brassica rapa]